MVRLSTFQRVLACVHLVLTNAVRCHSFTPTTHRRADISVTLKQGTFVGTQDVTFGTDTFLGIPYAKPPIGSLRFARPQPVSPSQTVFQATKYGKACIQPPSNGLEISEDCLTLNIIRPTGANSGSALPVVVYVYGGSLQSGTSASYDGTGIVAASVTLKEPIIYVSFNYRLSSLGFLASKEIQEASKQGEATLNAGLYDTRAVFQWVQDNIGAFGGDKSKVTAMGQSAGAISIGSLLIANNGTEASHLFRGAIMQSGAPSGDNTPTVIAQQPYYDIFVKAAGCSSRSSSLACLRSVNIEAIKKATSTAIQAGTAILQPFGRVQDDFFHLGPPKDIVRDGKVAEVPLLIGNNLDEGTFFTPHNINNEDDYNTLLRAVFRIPLYEPSVDPAFAKLGSFYPDDPSVGSPYDLSASSLQPSDRIYGPKNQYKRGASVAGDAIFQSGRRLLLTSLLAKHPDYPAYVYLFAELASGADPALGVFHGSEIPFMFGLKASDTDAQGDVSRYMVTSWIHFINNLDPNRAGQPTWPRYGTDRIVQRIRGNSDSASSTGRNITALMVDNYREAGIAFLNSPEWDALNDPSQSVSSNSASNPPPTSTSFTSSSTTSTTPSSSAASSASLLDFTFHHHHFMFGLLYLYGILTTIMM